MSAEFFPGGRLRDFCDFDILRRLDEGHGRGAAFLGALLEHPERRVVMKIHFGDQTERLLREATRTPRHRAAAQVLGVARMSDQFFIVREWIEGETLRSVAARPPSAERLRKILSAVTSVAECLAVLHRREERNGWVHRRVTADNVIVRPDESGVLINFDYVEPVFSQETRREVAIVVFEDGSETHELDFSEDISGLRDLLRLAWSGLRDSPVVPIGAAVPRDCGSWSTAEFRPRMSFCGSFAMRSMLTLRVQKFRPVTLRSVRILKMSARGDYQAARLIH